MNVQDIISKMTLQEKIRFCTGADMWHTKEMPDYGIPAIMMADGPHGLRCQKGENDILGINRSVPSTCFPTAVTASATWNRDLYAQEGEAIGREALAEGVSVVLGPGCNIKRNPLGGRNFEYLSEDPYLAGKMAASFIQGQKKSGAGSSLKHFAVNNQEYKRLSSDSQLDERTLREIYLTPFEIAVKEAQPATVMCSYNKINGVHASDSKELLTDILREEWGFEGCVVTDWGALNDRREAFAAGCDLNMPGGTDFMIEETLEAVRNGVLSEKDIDRSVERILKLVHACQTAEVSQKQKEEMHREHHALAALIAKQGAVLLKNEEQILPAKEEDFVLLGQMAEQIRYQGTGSSHINPTQIVNVTDAMPAVGFLACSDEMGKVSQQDLEDAKKAALAHKIPVVCVGLPEYYESEGFDREHMKLPEGYDRLVNMVADTNPNTVVVLFGGSPMELPWADKVKAILYMGLPGQAGGEAVADLLTGRAVPGGKLTETWPLVYEDVICKDTFGKKNTEYREGIYTGYRYYDKAQKPVRYPFGHGLSYTTFMYSNLNVTENKVTVTVKNTGDVAGAEVVQLYIAPPAEGIFRPLKELKGFRRLELAPGESQEAVFELDERSFAIWDQGWKVYAGTYTVMVGASGRDIRLEAALEVAGKTLPDTWNGKNSWYETLQGTPSRKDWEQLMGKTVEEESLPRKGSFTMDNSCQEMMKHSLIMKIQYKVTEMIIAQGFDGKKDMSDPAFRMMLTMATDAPLRSLIINGGGMVTEPLAHMLLHMANGRYLKGILEFIRRQKQQNNRKKG